MSNVPHRTVVGGWGSQACVEEIQACLRSLLAMNAAHEPR